MPAAANVVINDGAATPVAHTFTPTQKDTKGVLWFEQITPAITSQLAAKKIGYKQIRGNLMARQSVENGTVTFSVIVPTLEAIGTSDSGYAPPPRVAYKEVARLSFDLSERSIKQERKDTRVLSQNLLGSQMAIDAIDNLLAAF